MVGSPSPAFGAATLNWGVLRLGSRLGTRVVKRGTVGFTAPLHKASGGGGGYTECSPRGNLSCSGLEGRHGWGDTLAATEMVRRAYCREAGVAQGGGTHEKCGTQPLETRL